MAYFRTTIPANICYLQGSEYTNTQSLSGNHRTTRCNTLHWVTLNSPGIALRHVKTCRNISNQSDAFIFKAKDSLCSKLHGITAQKTVMLMLTALKTSNIIHLKTEMFEVLTAMLMMKSFGMLHHVNW